MHFEYCPKCWVQVFPLHFSLQIYLADILLKRHQQNLDCINPWWLLNHGLMSLLLFENIGTFNVREVFWMRQCNCTKNDEATFFILNIDCFLCKTGYCRTWMKTRNAQLSRSSCYIFTFLCLSLTHLLQVKQTVKVQ